MTESIMVIELHKLDSRLYAGKSAVLFFSFLCLADFCEAL